MTYIAFTGSRPPSGGFTLDEIVTVAAHVRDLIHSDCTVATGGCQGIDEIVMRTVLACKRTIRNLQLVTFPADGERSWTLTRAPIGLIEQSDTVHWRERGWKYLERDRAMVNAVDGVYAIPLNPFTYTRSGMIQPVRGSGTNYTARYADEHGKLRHILSLRPVEVTRSRLCVGRPGDRHLIGTWCKSETPHEPHTFLKTDTPVL